MPDQPSDKSARILFYSDSRYYSGAEKIFSLIISRLASDYPGSVVVLSADIKSDLTRALPDWESLPLTWEFSATQLKINISEMARIKKLIQMHHLQAAIINMWSPYANTIGIVAARLAKIPCATIFHYFQHKHMVRGPIAPLKLAAYRWAGAVSSDIVTVSEAHKKVLSQEYKLPTRKIHVIPNGLDINSPVPQKSFGAPRRLLCVGTLEDNKGQAYLLPLLKNLEGEWTLSFVGDGPHRQMLEQATQSLGLESHIHFLGKRTDMEAIYREHDVLVHPSFAENLSMAILEALAHGLPVIAHDVGGNSELIENHKEGWLLPLKNDEAWITVLSEAVAGNNLKQYSTNAVQKWHQHFQLDHTVEGYRALITKLIGKR